MIVVLPESEKEGGEHWLEHLEHGRIRAKHSMGHMGEFEPEITLWRVPPNTPGATYRRLAGEWEMTEVGAARAGWRYGGRAE